MSSAMRHCQGCGIPEGAHLVRYRWNKRLQALQPRGHGLAVLTETDFAGHDRRLLCQLCRSIAIEKRGNLAVTGLANPGPAKKPEPPDERQLSLVPVERA